MKRFAFAALPLAMMAVACDGPAEDLGEEKDDVMEAQAEVMDEQSDVLEAQAGWLKMPAIPVKLPNWKPKPKCWKIPPTQCNYLIIACEQSQHYKSQIWQAGWG